MPQAEGLMNGIAKRVLLLSDAGRVAESVDDHLIARRIRVLRGAQQGQYSAL
jgi:hypothetical protein